MSQPKITDVEQLHYVGVFFDEMHKRGVAEVLSRNPDTGLPNRVRIINEDVAAVAASFEEAERQTGISIEMGRGLVRSHMGGTA